MLFAFNGSFSEPPLIFITIPAQSLDCSSSHPQKHSIINSRNNIYLIISKSRHHPTNKKPHECGAGGIEKCRIFLTSHHDKFY